MLELSCKELCADQGGDTPELPPIQVNEEKLSPLLLFHYRKGRFPVPVVVVFSSPPEQATLDRLNGSGVSLKLKPGCESARYGRLRHTKELAFLTVQPEVEGVRTRMEG